MPAITASLLVVTFLDLLFFPQRSSSDESDTKSTNIQTCMAVYPQKGKRIQFSSRQALSE